MKTLIGKIALKLVGGRQFFEHSFFTAQENFLLSLTKQGYLVETGWSKSFDLQKPVDANGKPLPWVTYSFIDFVTPRLKSGLDILEFGSGNSTIFFGTKGCNITAIEHVQEWVDIVTPQLPPSAKLIQVDLVDGGDYSHSAVTLGQQWDIVFVDGRDRVNCALNSIPFLKPEGVLVLDDSDRPQYSPIYARMKELGYKVIDFWGISPGLCYRKSTSVFYKSDANILGI